MSDNLFFALWIAGVCALWIVIVLIAFRIRKKKGNVPAGKKRTFVPAEVPAAPGLSREETERLLAKIEADTRKESIRAILKEESAPALASSKVGGYPYWDPAIPYPCDSKGRPLALLAQIDLSDLPENDSLPCSGLLQFFVLPDDMHGMNYDARDDQDGFRVIYHETVDRSVTEEAIRALDVPTSLTCGDLLPHTGEFVLEFKKETVHMGLTDARFDEKLRRAAADLSIELPEGSSPYLLFSQKDADPGWDEENAGSRLLGYPYFVQDDPRPADTEYDTLLFQLDSYYAVKPHPASSPERFVMWGDSGVGCFLIRSEDLAAKRFDRVYYTWDCC